MRLPLQEEHEGAGSHQPRQRTWENLSCRPDQPLPGDLQAEGTSGAGPGQEDRAQLLHALHWQPALCPSEGLWVHTSISRA